MARWVQRYWALPVVMAFVLVIAGVSMFGRLGLHRPPQSVPVPVRTQTDVIAPMPPPLSGSRLGILFVLLVGFFALVVIGTLALLIYTFVRWLQERQPGRKNRFGKAGKTGPTDDDLEQQRDDVLAAVDAGIADLMADDSDPRGAVIACWVRLEAVAAAAGLDQHPGATSSDLVANLLASQRVSVDVLTSLADLYRTARYSQHVIEATMRDEARAALIRLRGEIVIADPVTA